jgi:hypothetical protein
MRSRLPSSFACLVALLLLAAPVAVSAQTFDLVASVAPGTAGTVTISADGREACRVTVSGSEPKPPTCRTTLRRDARRLSVEVNPSSWLRSRKTTQYTLVAADAVTASLRTEAPSSSLRALAGRLDALLSQVGSTDKSDSLGWSLGAPVASDALAAAEKRLGFALDPALRAVLLSAGPVSFDDSWMVEPKQFDTTDRQFEALWGAPEKPSASALAIYRQSTMAWVEAGDGYGAVIYQPRESSRCGGAPAYWRIHQESIHAPELVTTADGKCGDLRHALFAMFGRDLLERLNDAALADRLLVDTSAPVVEAWLSIDRDGVPSLRVGWEKLR